jgi:hypothetical protein
MRMYIPGEFRCLNIANTLSLPKTTSMSIQSRPSSRHCIKPRKALGNIGVKKDRNKKGMFKHRGLYGKIYKDHSNHGIHLLISIWYPLT